MKRSLFAVLLASLFVVPPAYANYGCVGTVTYLGVANDGAVTVAGPGGIPAVTFCQLNATTPNGFTPDACKAAYATLLAAKISGQFASVDFSDSLTCATQPQWTRWAAVYFVNTSANGQG